MRLLRCEGRERGLPEELGMGPGCRECREKRLHKRGSTLTSHFDKSDKPKSPLLNQLPKSRSKSRLLSSRPNIDVKSSNPVDMKSKPDVRVSVEPGGADADGGGAEGAGPGVGPDAGLEVAVAGREGFVRDGDGALGPICPGPGTGVGGEGPVEPDGGGGGPLRGEFSTFPGPSDLTCPPCGGFPGPFALEFVAGELGGSIFPWVGRWPIP